MLQWQRHLFVLVLGMMRVLVTLLHIPRQNLLQRFSLPCLAAALGSGCISARGGIIIRLKCLLEAQISRYGSAARLTDCEDDFGTCSICCAVCNSALSREGK